MKMRSILKASVAFTLLVTPAAADPVTGLIIGSTILGSTTLAAVASFVVTSALEIGLALAVTKIAGLFEHAPERQAQVLQLALGEAPRDVIFGTAETGGSLVDVWNYGGDNDTDWEVQRIALCDHKASLVGYRVNNQYYAFTGDGPVADFNNQLKIYFRPGTLTQVPPADLAGEVGVSESDNAAGVAEVWVAYKADKQDSKDPVWPGGRPKFKWLVRGKACYDPRKDSTVPGGSGAHRWSNPATWEYTRNPIICRYNWARGIFAGDQIGDPGALLLGRGLSAEEAPPQRVFAWANICDEEVPQRYLNAALIESALSGAGSIKLSSADGVVNGTQIRLSRGLANEEIVTAASVSGSGGVFTVTLSGSLSYSHPAGEQGDWESDPEDPALRPRYAIDGVLHSDEPFEIHEALFAAACAGRMIQPEGGVEIEPGYAKAPVFDLTDGDLLGGAPVSWSDFSSRATRINTIVPSFTDPAQLWVNHAAPVRRSSADIDADGGPKEDTLSLQLVTVLSQAQELGEIERRRRRYERVCTIPLGPRWSCLEEGDCGYYTSARRAGGVQLFWEVVSVSVGEGRRTMVTLRETGPEVFDFDPFEDELPPTGGNLPSATPRTAVLPSGVILDSYTETGTTGRERPGATVTFDPPDNAGIVRFQVEYRVQGSTHSYFAYTEEVSGGLLSLPGLLPHTTYEYRYRFVSVDGTPTPFSDWFTFTTPDVRVPYAELTQALKDAIDQVAVNTDAVGFLNDARDKADARLRQLYSNLGRIGTALLEVQMVIPQLEDRYQRQLASYVSTVTGTDVSQFAARLLVSEQTIIDLQNNKAAASALAALDALISTPTTGLIAIVGQLQETVASLDESQATATLLRTAAAVRIAGQKIQSLANTVLNLESIIQNLQKGQATTLAWFQEEITTQVKEGQSALARAVADLGAFLKSADGDLRASVLVEQEARVAGDTAQAQTSAGILAILSGYSTPGSVQAAVNSASNAYVSPLGAVAGNVDTIASYFGSGINATTTVKSLIDAANTARADGDNAVASGAAALVESEANTRADADEALAEDVTSLYSAYDSVSASGYFSIITQSAPAGASARAALVISQTSGGAPNTAAMFMDALTSGLTRILFKAAQTAFLDASNNVVALFDSSGAHLTAGVFADNGILGPKVQLGEMTKPYTAKLGSSVFTDNTASSVHEVLRVSGVRSLGGAITVHGWLNAKKNGSGTYGFANWVIRRTSVGGSFGLGTNLDVNEFYMNDGGEVHRGVDGFVASGTIAYDGFCDIVLAVQNQPDPNKPIEIYDAKLTVVPSR